MRFMNNFELNELLSMIRDGAGADQAFAELLSRYTPLMRSRVSMYSFSGAELSEAMQEASRFTVPRLPMIPRNATVLRSGSTPVFVFLIVSRV